MPDKKAAWAGASAARVAGPRRPRACHRPRVVINKINNFGRRPNSQQLKLNNRTACSASKGDGGGVSLWQVLPSPPLDALIISAVVRPHHAFPLFSLKSGIVLAVRQSPHQSRVKSCARLQCVGEAAIGAESLLAPAMIFIRQKVRVPTWRRRVINAKSASATYACFGEKLPRNRGASK